MLTSLPCPIPSTQNPHLLLFCRLLHTPAQFASFARHPHSKMSAGDNIIYSRATLHVRTSDSGALLDTGSTPSKVDLGNWMIHILCVFHSFDAVRSLLPKVDEPSNDAIDPSEPANSSDGDASNHTQLRRAIATISRAFDNPTSETRLDGESLDTLIREYNASEYVQEQKPFERTKDYTQIITWLLKEITLAPHTQFGYLPGPTANFYRCLSKRRFILAEWGCLQRDLLHDNRIETTAWANTMHHFGLRSMAFHSQVVEEKCCEHCSIVTRRYRHPLFIPLQYQKAIERISFDQLLQEWRSPSLMHPVNRFTCFNAECKLKTSEQSCRALIRPAPCLLFSVDRPHAGTREFKWSRIENLESFKISQLQDFKSLHSQRGSETIIPILRQTYQIVAILLYHPDTETTSVLKMTRNAGAMECYHHRFAIPHPVDDLAEYLEEPNHYPVLLAYEADTCDTPVMPMPSLRWEEIRTGKSAHLPSSSPPARSINGHTPGDRAAAAEAKVEVLLTVIKQLIDCLADTAASSLTPAASAGHTRNRSSLTTNEVDRLLGSIVQSGSCASEEELLDRVSDSSAEEGASELSNVMAAELTRRPRRPSILSTEPRTSHFDALAAPHNGTVNKNTTPFAHRKDLPGRSIGVIAKLGAATRTNLSNTESKAASAEIPIRTSPRDRYNGQRSPTTSSSLSSRRRTVMDPVPAPPRHSAESSFPSLLSTYLRLHEAGDVAKNPPGSTLSKRSAPAPRPTIPGIPGKIHDGNRSSIDNATYATPRSRPSRLPIRSAHSSVGESTTGGPQDQPVPSHLQASTKQTPRPTNRSKKADGDL